jgi:phenylalanyl-tRNA synthetase beta chain
LVCAVLRGLHFTPESYASFIDLQEKLHQNLCRRRTLASIGTHDMRKCKPPFVYRGEKPEDIIFVPLTGGPELNGRQLFENLKSHVQLSKYLPLLDNEPIWPVIRDADGAVCSLPPIINSDKTKIDLETTDVFIDCTAVDRTRAMNAVIVLCAAFSLYASTPFTIEQVSIVHEGQAVPSPIFENSEFTVDVGYIRTMCGLHDLDDTQIIGLLTKMMLKAEAIGDGKLKVIVPPSRSDVLHACDIAEDVAIAFGYDNIANAIAHPIQSGCPLSINELTDRIRREVVACLWNEVLTFSLCSEKENFDFIRVPNDGSAARLKNAKTIDFEIVRTSLLPGLLKVTRRILSQPGLKKPLPLRLFEISDIVKVDAKADVGARNERRFCATIADVRSRFEDIHGLLDRFFVMNAGAYKLVGEDSPTCIPGQRARVMYMDQPIGWIGVIHPLVLQNFNLTTPVVGFELLVEPFLTKH